MPVIDVIQKVYDWSRRRLLERLARRWGMIRTCPWCRQCVETDGRHQMRASDLSPMFDTFTCGVCGGESHWEFGPAPMIRGLGSPPAPASWATKADDETRRILQSN